MKKIITKLFVFMGMISLSQSLFAAPVVSSRVVGEMILPTKNVTDKNAYLEERDKISKNMLENKEKQSRVVTINFSGRDEAPCNGDILVSKFESVVECPGLDTHIDGNSKAVWLGTNPSNCDTIQLIDNITVNGIGLSASGGGSWSITGGITSKNAVWKSPVVENEWMLEHNISNLSFTGMDLYMTQEAQGEYSFGTRYYSTNARDQKSIG